MNLELKKRDAEIVRLRFDNRLTLDQIAILADVSRERVRQILVREKGTSGEPMRAGPRFPELHTEEFWEGRTYQTVPEIAAETGYTIHTIQSARFRMGLAPTQLRAKHAASGVKRCGGYGNASGACGEIKPLDQFYSDRNRSDGKYSRCKVCVLQYQRRRYRMRH